MMSGMRFNQTFQKFWHFHRFQIALEMNKSLLKLSVGFKNKKLGNIEHSSRRYAAKILITVYT